MASALATSSGCLRSSVRTSGGRLARPVPFTPAAIARGCAATRSHSLRRELHLLRAGVKDELVTDEDMELLSEGSDLDEPMFDEEELADDGDLVEGVEEALLDALSAAAIEREFIKGTAGSADTEQYLAALETDAVQIALDTAAAGEGDDAEIEEALSAVAAASAADAAEVDITAVQAPTRGFEMEEPDVLEALDNDEAAQALDTIRTLKLSKDELKGLVPGDWDSTTVDWFSDGRKGEELPLPEYKLTFLWMEKNIAVGVDHVYARGQTSPLTEFFFWPRKDAWEELKASLEQRPWISERDKVILLNRLTEVINFWQDEAAKHSVDDARSAFPDCSFSGATV